MQSEDIDPMELLRATQERFQRRASRRTIDLEVRARPRLT